MTLEQFVALPEGPPNFEFERGRVIPMASPTLPHQDVTFELTRVLKDFSRSRAPGLVFMGVDVFLPDEEHVYIPDVGFLSAPKVGMYSAEDKKIHGAPDLVVEVLSTEPDRDRVEKFRVYFDNAVSWYWIVDPEHRTIEEYHAMPEGYVRTASIMAGEEFRPRLFDGMAINLSTLLAPPSLHIPA